LISTNSSAYIGITSNAQKVCDFINTYLLTDRDCILFPSEPDRRVFHTQLPTPKVIPIDSTYPIKILIADDHPVVREGLVALINRRPEMTVVAEASNGQELVTEFLLHRPDIALADLRMPIMDGIDAITAIHEQIPNARLIVLTTYDDEADILRSIQAGAKAYMLKDTPREELVACIKAVHEGRTLIPPIILKNLNETIGAHSLTTSELNVLKLVIDGKFNHEIATKLFISESSVKSLLSAVLKKLNASEYKQVMTGVVMQSLLQ